MFCQLGGCRPRLVSAGFRNVFPLKRSQGINGALRMRSATTPMKIDDGGGTGAAIQPQPFSEMPLAGRGHWIANVFEILFLNGGWQYSLFKIQDQARNGSPVCRRLNAMGDEVHVCDPEVVQFVMSLEGKYPQRLELPAMNEFYERHKKEPGVFFLNGEKWRKLKLAMSKKMLRPPQMNSYIPRINSVALDMTARIKQERNSTDDQFIHEVDEIDMELFKWSFETVANFLFDREFNSLSNNPPKRTVEFINAVGTFLENIVPVSILPPVFHRYFKIKAFEKFDTNFLHLYKTAEELIEEKLQDISQKIAHDESKTDLGLIPYLLSGKISEDEIGCSIVDTLFAGVDTTSNTMQWMLYCLAKNPDVQEEIRNEISNVVHSNSHISEEELQKLPLSKAAIKETLRLYPVLITTGRTLDCDTVLSGYHVPAGTRIFFLHHAMGRREDLFPQADSFIPERWLRENNRPHANAFASIPFGFGVRMCLGRRLAELELQILLIKILQNFKLEIPPQHVVKQRLRGTNIPDKPVRVKFVDL